MSSWCSSQTAQGWSSGSWHGWQQDREGWHAGSDRHGWQAGSDRQFAADSQAGVDRHGYEDDFLHSERAPARRVYWPRFEHKKSQERRGRGKGGSKHGWAEDSEQEEMPSWLIMSILVVADLARLRDRRQALQDKVEADVGCVRSWRKERHSEYNMPSPYRVTVRGFECRVALEYVIDIFCDLVVANP